MIMDSKNKQFSEHQNSSEIDDLSYIPIYDPFLYTEIGYVSNIPSPDLNFMSIPFDTPDSEPNNSDPSLPMNPGGDQFIPPTSAAALGADGGESSDFSLGLDWSPAGEASSSPSGDSDDSSDPLMKYLSEMLMEDNIDDKPYMFDDLIALRTTEESLYNVLGEQYPPSVFSNLAYLNEESPNSNQSGSGSDYGGGNASFSPKISSSTSTSAGLTIGTIESFDPQQDGDFGGELNSTLLQAYLPNGQSYNSNLQQDLKPNLQVYELPENRTDDDHATVNELSSTSASAMVQNMFSDSESVLMFKKGLEEASKFLPNASLLSINLDSYSFASGRREENPMVVVKDETLARGTLPNSWRSRKSYGREDLDLEEGRSNKQSAVSVEENVSAKDGDLSEMFDKVLLFPGTEWFGPVATGQFGTNKTVSADEQSNESKGRRGSAKRQGKKKESVDLRTLLILCAQAMSANDFRTANELLKQIRRHSSPQGDGSQRLAHYFANGLEARLAGSTTGVESLHVSLAAKKTTAADMLKAYQTIINACPFKKLSMLFSNKTIFYAAEKAATIHVVDFGVHFGFQWPALIQFFSMRPGGPPKLRITGIEIPQRGLRPAERIEETGRRLAKYCKQFNVPFEYHPIAEQYWENIRVDDLGLRSDEFIAVNCLSRFNNLFDETTGNGDCQRDAVLNLIRRINPDIFIHSEYNGSYNSPFFVSRFREALFHYSSFYDIFDCTLSREDPERLTIEAEFYGRAAINAIACEGCERVERAETYKQWQVRTLRAGFKQLPLNQGLLEKFRPKLENHYHKDFVIDQDGQWMLQGWKGRILCASTCWVPA